MGKEKKENKKRRDLFFSFWFWFWWGLGADGRKGEVLYIYEVIGGGRGRKSLPPSFFWGGVGGGGFSVVFCYFDPK